VYDSVGRTILKRKLCPVEFIIVSWTLPRYLDQLPNMAGKQYDAGKYECATKGEYKELWTK
jgi:hypothetical protein